jgi:hypothetical protein
MTELKVHCDCGQKYKFDVEPVNGQMPFTVACPICKRDGTAKANEMLQQMAVFKPLDQAPAPIYAAAPPPMAPPPIGAPPPPPAGAPRLRINAIAPAAEPLTAAVAAPPPIGPSRGTTVSPISGRPRMGAMAATAEEPAEQTSFAMGLLGAVVGALVGAAIYFFIYKAVGPFFMLRYFLALGVGGLTGWLASLLGKGEGSKELGGLAALFTIVGIIGAQYILEVHKLREDMSDTLSSSEIAQNVEDGGYSASVKEAKNVVKEIPTGSDSEVRLYLAKQQAEEGQPPKIETISNDEVKQFRDNELTNYQDLASGKLTKEQYWAKNGFDPKAAKKVLDAGETAANAAVSGVAVVLAVFKAGIFSMIVGAGLAYKLSTNARGG